jgi:hypothetical protein
MPELILVIGKALMERSLKKYHCGSRQAVWKTDLPQWYG